MNKRQRLPGDPPRWLGILCLFIAISWWAGVFAYGLMVPR